MNMKWYRELGCAIAILFSVVCTLEAGSVNWNKDATSGNRTDNLNATANWTGGYPANGSNVFMVWDGSYISAATKIVTNAATDVFTADSLSITNASDNVYGDTVFIYIKGTTFLTNGPGALLFAGSQWLGSSSFPITLNFSNSVTFKTATFTGQSGNATLTFAGGTVNGGSLSFSGGSGVNRLIVNTAMNLSSNLTVRGSTANNTVLLGGNTTVGGSLSVTGSQTSAYFTITNSTLTVSNGVFNVGRIDLLNLGVLNVVRDWTNNGVIAMAGGTLTGGTLTNQSGASLSGRGAVFSALVNSASVNASNGELRLLGAVSGAGAYRAVGSSSTLTFAGSGSISALFNTGSTVRVEGLLTNTSFFANRGTLTMDDGTYQSGNKVTNATGYVITGSGTLDAGVVNNGGTITVTGGSLTFTKAPVQSGNINVASSGTLNVMEAWRNVGTNTLLGGTVIGSTLTNSLLVTGYGTITAALVNNATVTATGGTLTFTTAPVQSGYIVVTNSGTLNVLQAWQNSGTVTLSGGTVIGSTLTNALLVWGYGTITPDLVNNATVTATNGELRLFGDVSGAGAYRAVAGASAATLTFAGSGSISALYNTGATVRVEGLLTNTSFFANRGTVTMAGGTYQSGNNVTNATGFVITGSGTLDAGVINSGGTITATNGELRLLGAVSGAGAYRAVAGASTATLTFAGSGSISALFNTGATVRVEGLLTNTSFFANRGTVTMAGGTYQSGNNVTNATGFVITGSGTLDARVVNNGGTITATGGTLTFTTALVQSGRVDVAGSGTLNVMQAWRNVGTNTLLGGTVIGSTLTNSLLVTGYGTITAALVNSNTVIATNGELRLLGAVSGAGAYRAVGSSSTLTFAGSGSISALYNTGATVRVEGLLTNTSFFANRGTLAMANGTYQSGNNVTNTTGFVITGSGTLDAGVVNNGGTITVTGGSLTFAKALVQSGNIDVTGSGTLNVLQAWRNSNTVTLLGGTVIGSTLTNSLLVTGNGTIAAALVNSGTVTATNGELRLLGAVSGAGAYRAVGSSSTLTFAGSGSISALFNTGATVRVEGLLTNTSFFANRGTVTLAGGTYQSGNRVTNATGFVITGSGTLDAGVVNNGGTITVTGGSLTFTKAPVQSGYIDVTGSDTLNVLQAWQNSGTLTLLGGTVIGSTLTNSLLVWGYGTIAPDLVNNGTVTATGGELRLLGAFSGAGAYRAVAASAATLTFAGSGSISALFNTDATVRVEGLLTNTGFFANGGTLTLAGGTYQSAANVTNAAGFVVENLAGTTGTLDAPLVNSGTISVNDGTLLLLQAPVQQSGAVNIAGAGNLNVAQDWANSGTINFTSGGAITGGTLTNTTTGVSGIAGAGFINGFLVNQGRLDFNGVTVSNDFLQTTGSFTLSGNATITGSATIGGGTFDLLGNGLSAGSVTVSGSGALTNAVDGGTVAAGAFSNAATVNVTANTFFKAPVVNTGLFVFQGAVSNSFGNSGTVTLNNNATITGALANSGTINVGANSLNVGQAWQNGGAVNLSGGTIAGSPVANAGAIGSSGTLAADLSNSGSINVTGAGMTFAEVVTNTGTGSIKVTGSTATFSKAVVNSGTLNFDPSTGIFEQKLVLTPTGVLIAGTGSVLRLRGDFENNSTQSNEFDLLHATVFFDGGGGVNTQLFTLAGANLGPTPDGMSNNFAIGTLVIGGSAGIVQLFGGATNSFALYVHDLTISSNSTLLLNGYTVYTVNPVVNEGLVVSDGGDIVMIPEPGSIVLVAGGLLLLVLTSRRQRARMGTSS